MDFATFSSRLQTELCNNILPFWINHALDADQGGFYGSVSSNGVADPTAPKGGILTARILWTFSHAYRVFGDSRYLQAADHAYQFFTRAFWDPEYGGTYWMVDSRGGVLNPKKQTYAQGFSIYGLSEYYLATGEANALHKAIQIYERLEQSALDPVHGGYFEAYQQNWTPAADVRLSEKEQNDPKTMNTHLHILEPYTNLLRAWPDARLRKSHAAVIHLFLERILNPATHHFWLFFDETFHPRTQTISFGHDIEGSWLLVEAAEISGDEALLAQTRDTALRMTDAVIREALDPDGAILYEMTPETPAAPARWQDEKEWWAQAEAMIGFLNAYQISGAEQYYTAAQKSWEFIETRQVNRTFGEWHRTLTRQGLPLESPLADFWKCPYHNSRACMEGIARLADLKITRGASL